VIGRQRELDRVLAAVERAREDGAATVALISGAAGIGKSTLVAAMDGSVHAGVTAHCRADEFDVGLPFSMVRDLMGRAGALFEPSPGVRDQLRQLVDRGTRGDEAAPETPRLDGVTRVVDAVAEAVRNAGEGLRLLVFEDIHCADRESLEFLPRLVRRIADVPACVVLTARPSRRGAMEKVQAFVERAEADLSGAHVRLGPWSAADVGELTASLTGHPASGEQVAELTTLSGGNPFILTQILATGGLGADASILAWTEGGSTLRSVLRRAFPADGDALELARLMAVLALGTVQRDALVHDFAPAVGMSTARAIEALKDLASSQLVVVDDGGDVIFTHPLLRRALAEDLDDERRRDLHVLAAGVLEGWLPSGSTDLAFDIASHWDEAAAGLVDDRAARACLRAAELAEPVAPTVAARWFERTLAHLPLDRKERVALHLRTVYAYLTTWSYREALAANSAAERELADSPAYGIIALAGALCRMMSGDPAQALKRLLALAPTAPLPEPTRFVRVAMEFLLRHTVGEPDQGGVGWAAIEAMAPAAADEDLVETVLGEIFLAAYASQNGLLAAFTRHADRIVRAGRLSPEASGRELVATAVYLDLIGPANLARASELLTSVAAGPVEDIRSIAMHGPATATAWCLLHWTAGNLVAAQQLARDAAAEMRSRRAGMLLAVVECIDALVGLECDQLREAERVVEQLEPRNPADEVLCDLARARHLQARGQVTAATTILEERWAAAVARGTVPFTALLAEELVVVLQAAGRDADAAALADDSLRRTVDHGMPLPEVQALRAVTRASGDPEPCRRALLVADERGYVFEALLCRQVLGSMGEAPRENLTAAWHGFRDLGALRSLRLTTKALREWSLPIPRRRKGAGSRPGRSLTESEEQLVSLILQGLTNRQIAERLYLSPKTVEVYLSRLYRTLGVANRIELIVRSEESERGWPQPRPAQGATFGAATGRR
jgi:DNA-binding NarL/FixJ family response regulator